MPKHPLLSRWKSMIQRCTNPRNPAYHRYGGRGIRVCDRWRESFEDFVADVGVPEDLSLTLDRIDNDGDYAPGNVRWASRMEQALNRPGVRWIEWRGRRLPVAQAARAAGLHESVVHARIFSSGWSVERALTTPADPRFRPHHVHKTYTAPRRRTGAVYVTGGNR